MLELVDAREQLTPFHIVRPEAVAPVTAPVEAVREIVQDVRLRGDAALVELTNRFDGATLRPEELLVPSEEIVKARALVRPEVIEALETMAGHLTETHRRQVPQSWNDGRWVGEVVRPLQRVGVYVPGGRAAYPSSVLMGAIPARAAGVERIAVVSPPDARGELPEPVLAACAIAGVDEVYRIGGAQAIGALAYGTETVRPVEKIVGPGNIYVTLAKRLVSGDVAIDTEAGPSEICIVADGSADPVALAADLIAQAEHGPLGVHALITWESSLADRVLAALEHQVMLHPRSEDVENALIEGGTAVIVRDKAQALQTANALAPEHLQLWFDGARDAVAEVKNAGAIFVGGATPVPAGDYVAGTNHVLPTGGAARYSSGLSARDFVKHIYVLELDSNALADLAPHIDALAGAEGLPGHARAVWERVERP